MAKMEWFVFYIWQLYSLYCSNSIPNWGMSLIILAMKVKCHWEKCKILVYYPLLPWLKDCENPSWDLQSYIIYLSLTLTIRKIFATWWWDVRKIKDPLVLTLASPRVQYSNSSCILWQKSDDNSTRDQYTEINFPNFVLKIRTSLSLI